MDEELALGSQHWEELQQWKLAHQQLHAQPGEIFERDYPITVAAKGSIEDHLGINQHVHQFESQGIWHLIFGTPAFPKESGSKWRGGFPN